MFRTLGPTPPYPDTPREPWPIHEHGVTRQDEYHWLANREDPRVIPWLLANNRHAEQTLAATTETQRLLVDELHRLIPPDEGQAAWQAGGIWFRTYYPPEQNHPVFARLRDSPLGAPEILIEATAGRKTIPSTTWKASSSTGICPTSFSPRTSPVSDSLSSPSSISTPAGSSPIESRAPNP